MKCIKKEKEQLKLGIYFYKLKQQNLRIMSPGNSQHSFKQYFKQI